MLTPIRIRPVLRFAGHWLTDCSCVALVVAFVGLNILPPQLAAQETQKRSSSVSTGGVARIVDRDFAKPFAGQATDKNQFHLPKNQTAETQSKNGTSPAEISQLPAGLSGAATPPSANLDPKPSPRKTLTQPVVPPKHNDPLNVDSDSKSSSKLESVNESLPGLNKNADSLETATPQDEQMNTSSSESVVPESQWSFQKLTDRKTLPSTIQMFVSVAAISLVPAILLMTTCFIRIVVVLGILRQAIGLQQLPPTQVTTALALMMTFLIMAPTWKQVKTDAVDPYTAEDSTMTWDEAWQAGVAPVKKFMWNQIRRAENEKDFWVFYDYLPEEERSKEPESIDEIPLRVLLPAFMISELKVAFLIGLQVLLPFLILDIVVASLCNTMGLIMLPPAVVSLPLKLLLFVMVDGWNLVVAMLLNSFSLL